MQSTNRNIFALFHPIVNIMYFMLMVLLTLFLLHPAFLAVGLLSSLIYMIILVKAKVRYTLAFTFPLFILIALLNPLFVHQGTTILFYAGYNPVTLEAVLYGLVSAVMLITVIFWFICCNQVVDTEKLLYLFGKLIPSSALLISMSLRLVPRLKNQYKEIYNGQNMIGKGADSGNVLLRLKNSLRVFSILVTWALEDSIETADSMKARGYGQKKRTAFHLFRFEKRDGVILLIMGFAVMLLWIFHQQNVFYVQYYPVLQFSSNRYAMLFMLLIYGALCLLPVILEIMEEIKWRRLRLKN